MKAYSFLAPLALLFLSGCVKDLATTQTLSGEPSSLILYSGTTITMGGEKIQVFGRDPCPLPTFTLGISHVQTNQTCIVLTPSTQDVWVGVLNKEQRLLDWQVWQAHHHKNKWCLMNNHQHQRILH